MSVNPLLLEGGMATLVSGLMYSYLLTVDGEGRLRPDAAEVVPTLENGGVSLDGMTITYHVRPGIRWQDGAPLTARDCVFTFHAIMNPRNNVPSREGYTEIASVAAGGDNTVVVRLKRPYSPIVASFLSIASNYPILPAHLWSQHGNLNRLSLADSMVGSGPFRLVQWLRGDRMRFVANAAYFRGRPGLAGVVLKFIPSDATLVNELRTHEIDATLDLDDPQVYDQVRAIAGSRVLVTLESGVMVVGFNTASGPNADLRVRRALVQGIDAAFIVNRASRGLYENRDALRGMFGPDYQPISGLSYAPATARRTLDSAGWHVAGDGIRVKNGRQLVLSLALESTSVIGNIIAVTVQQELRAIGASVSVRVFAPSFFVAPAAAGGPLFGGKFDVILLPVVVSPAGPEAGSYFTCNQRMPAGFNYTRLCDRSLDDAFARSVRTYDVRSQRRDVAMMEQELVSQAPQVALYQLHDVSVVPSSLSGYAPSVESPYVDAGNWAWLPAPKRP